MFIIPALQAEDLSLLSAVQLNTRGFLLYQEGRFRESLEYFKASFTKDPAYPYAHYNYACVGSVLHARDDLSGLYVPELEYHLLTAMRLSPRYRLKWQNDPDLAWYRKELENKNPHKPQRALKHYLNSFNERDLRRSIVREDHWYILSYIGSGRLHLKLKFFADGSLAVADCSQGDPDTISLDQNKKGGKYSLFGNIVYFHFQPPVRISEYGEEIPDTLTEIYCLYHDGFLRIIYCLNDRIDISPVADLGDGA
jgi:tetratricopeptide (TPR) repeat protein